MSNYPNDGMRHPTVSDLLREVGQALVEAGPPLFIWVFAAIVLFSYPDWRTITDAGLFCFGLAGLAFLRNHRCTTRNRTGENKS